MEDQELKAMQEIVTSLQDLDAQGRDRVLTYVYSRLGISLKGSATQGQTPAPAFQPQTLGGSAPAQSPSYQYGVTDIRTLKEEKKPANDTEMAVLVAYYLSELAPEIERKSEIQMGDITTYFKQAGYPLPTTPRMTLVHAKNAGYFESVERGVFKINPVGYNLAAHSMGQEGRAAPAPRKSRAKRAVAKAAKKTVKKTAK